MPTPVERIVEKIVEVPQVYQVPVERIVKGKAVFSISGKFFY